MAKAFASSKDAVPFYVQTTRQPEPGETGGSFRYLTAMASPVHNIAWWLSHWSEVAGDRLAVIDPKNRLSYRALEERLRRLARWLADSGIQSGDRIALVLANGSPYLEAVLAAARIGAIALPINSRLSPSEMALLLEDSSPAVLFHTARFASTVHDACSLASSPAPRLVQVGGRPDPHETEIMGSEPDGKLVEADPEDPMMLMYTSGSSGQPKGALLPHRKTYFNSLNAQIYFGIRPEDRVLICTPLFHSLGLNILALPALCSGATLILHDGFDPGTVWNDVAREGVTYLGGVPAQYQRMYEALQSADAPKTSSLRFLFTAGAAIPVELIPAYAERNLVLKQGYGQTETSILTCLDENDAIRKAGSVGRPVFHGEVRVVPREFISESTEEWRPTEVDETGEVVVRGPIHMLRYWNQPEETAEVLRDDWLRTTDLATRDEEGFLTLVGRVRDMFISSGENVYPAAIEAVYGSHPSVSEIAVVGIPDPEWGEVGRAHVVLAEGCRLDPDALRSWGRERLAGFKVPRAFTAETKLPRTVSGKVKKYLLRDRTPAAHDREGDESL